MYSLINFILGYFHYELLFVEILDVLLIQICHELCKDSTAHLFDSRLPPWGHDVLFILFLLKVVHVLSEFWIEHRLLDAVEHFDNRCFETSVHDIH